MNLIEKMILKTDNDIYYNYLFSKIEKMYFDKILQARNSCQLTIKECEDLLRYADILSRAVDSQHRQEAYKIISYMNEFYKNNEEFKIVAESILIIIIITVIVYPRDPHLSRGFQKNFFA